MAELQPRLPRLLAAQIGVVSVAAALGVGHLIAGMTTDTASPFIAVGNGFIDRTPQWLKNFAIEQFGTNDKFVLKLGLFMTLFVVAALAGALSRRSALPGLVIVLVLGTVGGYAVYDRPTFQGSDLVAPIGAFIVGAGSFVLLQSLGIRHTATTSTVAVRTAEPDPAAAPPPERSSLTRRGVLVATAAVAAGAAVSGYLGERLTGTGRIEAARRELGPIRPTLPSSPIPAGADFAELGTPTFITPNSEFYRIDVNLILPRIRPEDWRLRIHGMVENEMTLDWSTLTSRPLVDRPVTMCCVSNEVGGPYISTAQFTGVLLRDILREAEVAPGADQILTTSHDGWTCGTPTDVVLDPDREAMLVVAMNGEPLPIEHGFPVRVLVPGLYGFVSGTKWIVDMKLTTFAEDRAYWRERGWATKAPIRTQSRIDSIRALTADDIVIAGIAWAPPRGIDHVEIRIDDGPWTAAALSTEVSPNTWRMWQLTTPRPPRGRHTVQVRATDRSGYTQTDDSQDPIPDGATGWHSVRFTAL